MRERRKDSKSRVKLKLDGDVDTSHGNDKFVVALYDKRSYIYIYMYTIFNVKTCLV